MLAQAGKEFMVRVRFFWRPFQGRHMLLTNTLSAGSMLALGDYLQQCREIYKEPGKERCWKRTGERGQFIRGFVPLELFTLHVP